MKNTVTHSSIEYRVEWLKIIDFRDNYLTLRKQLTIVIIFLKSLGMLSRTIRSQRDKLKYLTLSLCVNFVTKFSIK
jgi:hypothetical protein